MTAGINPVIGSLYPFLNGQATDADALVEGVARSTREKAAEIVALRRSLVAEQGSRLVDCARRCSAAFRSGARLLAFGNGGSSTDAQDVAQLFLHPPAAARP